MPDDSEDIRCIWVPDEQLGMIFIPGCWGGVINGPGGCNCLADETWKQRFRYACNRVERAEAYGRWAQKQLQDAGLRAFPLMGEI